MEKTQYKNTNKKGVEKTSKKIGEIQNQQMNEQQMRMINRMLGKPMENYVQKRKKWGDILLQ